MRRGRRQGRAAGSGLDPAHGRARRNSQAERLSLGNSRRSARLGSARLGSARLGSARLGSARLGSARLGSARLGSARLGSARLGSARLGSARLIIAVSKCSLDVKSFFDIFSKSPDHTLQPTRDAVRHGSNELDPSPARSLHIRAYRGRRGHRQLIPAHPQTGRCAARIRLPVEPTLHRVPTVNEDHLPAPAGRADVLPCPSRATGSVAGQERDVR